MAAENSKQFWKRSAKLPGSIQPVYGAQHPPLDPRLTKNFIKERSKVNTVPLKNKKASSFHEFARNTSDAWDIGDDEEEDFSTPPFQTLNSKVALATAAQVLENHSKLRIKPERSQSTTSDVPANSKVVKSSSDAQLSRNSTNTERRKLTLQRKREEYFGFIEQYYDSRNEEHHQDTYRQIFERILFIWAIRHPASGYVQGINDLVTPFFVVFLSEYVEEDVENFDVTNLSQDMLRSIEADSFWCMSKLLDGIQWRDSELLGLTQGPESGWLSGLSETYLG
ncbi:TBC1 domain family member 22B [Tupaia chinensis]|uniref:TBC1 domain family member 22B n=1 Tax=Tupaia chinensis TaxID=246437 RepID=L9KTH3_TUPCH|nr:TBC1 domain family member 22B [Tupaia chinensis]